MKKHPTGLRRRIRIHVSSMLWGTATAADSFDQHERRLAGLVLDWEPVREAAADFLRELAKVVSDILAVRLRRLE